MKTRYVGFTGSKEVGLRISGGTSEQSAVPGQIWIKRTVLQMGSKDGMIVDEEADIDAAVEGRQRAAFGYQGQKCSACSRVIVSEKIYDTFLTKLVERTKKIRKVGPKATIPNNYMGPVVSETADEEEFSRMATSRSGKKEGRLDDRRRARGGRWLLCGADDYRGRGPEGAAGAGGSVWSGAGGDQGEDISMHAMEIANNTEFRV